ncbi:hypothetical protein [Luteolibacter soli]|uniref:SGNH hydrolase-type esterase domain-containing protein n=1 Tax=Luteolibacter soli TaxID=3135280 RepID=A0ABU9B2M5_9BACT
MKVFTSLWRVSLYLVAALGFARADPIEVGQVRGFTPGIHGAVELVFQSEVGKYYQVQISADMATWDNEGYAVKGTGGQVSILARTRNLPSAYFRLRDDGSAENAAPLATVQPTAADTLAALQAMNAAQRESALTAIQAAGTADLPLNGSRLLSTPHAFAKLQSGRPLRILPVGDSLALGFDIGPLMAKRGFIGLDVPDALKTGTVTNVNSEFTSWVTGNLQRFAPGSAGEFVPNGLLGFNGYTQGNRAAIAYIARPGAGTFRLRSKTSDGTLAVLAASIDASRDATGNPVSVPTGVVKEFALPTSTFPAFRLVMDNVTVGNVDVIFGAIVPTSGGGAIEIRNELAIRGGLEITDSLQTPPAILTPIWSWLAPDLVFSIWADAGSNWEAGGAWRTYYTRLLAACPDCDFVQITRNPSSGEDTAVDTQVAAEKAWAIETGECFIDVNSLFGGSFANAQAMEVMADNQHLNATGQLLRNRHIWKTLPLGQEQLGAFGPNRAFQAMSQPDDTPALKVSRQLALAAGLSIFDGNQTIPWDYWDISSWSRVMTFKRGNDTYFTFSAAPDGSAGFYGFDTALLGNASRRWRGYFSTANLSNYIEGTEQAAPPAPPADGFRIYAEDNGAGKTRLMVRFATGAPQQIAIQPKR